MDNKFIKISKVSKIPLRRKDSHKGDFGRILIVAGSRGMIGAPALCARSAFRGGAGLVTMAIPLPIQMHVATLCPCATSIPLECELADADKLSPKSVGQFYESASRADVLAVGPGMGVGIVQENIVRATIDMDKPAIIDADGLNNLANINDWAASVKCPIVLTPHPGEFSRLTGISTGGIQADRMNIAISTACKWNAASADNGSDSKIILVLKGAGTIVTDGERAFVNETGNPGMACGGSGDVLTGLLAGLSAQGITLFDAACLAVHVHGLAGDHAAEKLGQISMTAEDIIGYIPQAIKDL